MEMNNPFRIKALVVYDGIDEENATARALRALKRDLEESDVVVEVSQCICDAELIVTSDPTVQCALVYLDGAGDEKHRRIQHFLELLRSRNHDMPVFLMSNRTKASGCHTRQGQRLYLDTGRYLGFHQRAYPRCHSALPRVYPAADV